MILMRRRTSMCPRAALPLWPTVSADRTAVVSDIVGCSTMRTTSTRTHYAAT